MSHPFAFRIETLQRAMLRDKKSRVVTRFDQDHMRVLVSVLSPGKDNITSAFSDKELEANRFSPKLFNSVLLNGIDAVKAKMIAEKKKRKQARVLRYLCSARRLAAVILLLSTPAWAITPVPTPTRTPTPTPTPTPEPPVVVCSVTTPHDGQAHSVASRVYWLHQGGPCVLYHQSIEQTVGPGTVVEVEGGGSPVGADVWIDGTHVKACGQTGPIFRDGVESGDTGRWTPCATPTPSPRRTPVASEAGVPLLPDGGQVLPVPTPKPSGPPGMREMWTALRRTLGRWV